MKCHTPFFVESAVPDLVEQVCQKSRRKTLRGIMVHLDNARPDNSRKSEAALTAKKQVESLSQLIIQIYLRVTSSSLECSRNERREQWDLLSDSCSIDRINRERCDTSNFLFRQRSEDAISMREFCLVWSTAHYRVVSLLIGHLYSLWSSNLVSKSIFCDGFHTY
jgi:hypothetical protein